MLEREYFFTCGRGTETYVTQELNEKFSRSKVKEPIASIVDHEPAIDPGTHLGGGKADKVRWIAQGPTYHNHLVCLKSSCA